MSIHMLHLERNINMFWISLLRTRVLLRLPLRVDCRSELCPVVCSERADNSASSRVRPPNRPMLFHLRSVNTARQSELGRSMVVDLIVAQVQVRQRGVGGQTFTEEREGFVPHAQGVPLQHQPADSNRMEAVPIYYTPSSLSMQSLSNTSVKTVSFWKALASTEQVSADRFCPLRSSLEAGPALFSWS
ncbi:hypothetical protein EYF80_040196 [Liparis tanakae]|uniref:Uncharacterized protein n=1 Tax=Liparis tanakae TaxID=230148 RepID=A0A4Z2G7R1_9TELE|nr:hypothetical protein EYF80_040196 [Liparis tanakae]